MVIGNTSSDYRKAHKDIVDRVVNYQRTAKDLFGADSDPVVIALNTQAVAILEGDKTRLIRCDELARKIYSDGGKNQMALALYRLSLAGEMVHHGL
jgi:hypothetical protein